ncbi:MAG: LPS export ABC transporter periplasmic protein LptC [Desulfobacteraceae bacterium]|jgi:LPS export ABC transporter protein LptC|nr:LPS export ABC transporter periplasmic protein LptC [Desulfobacteraceae bacterium]
MSTRRIRLLRRLLIAATVLICLAVAAVYIGYRHFRRQAPVWTRTVGQQALMSMDQIHHTATRDGRTEWVLDARQARTDEDGAVVHLTDLTVRFFPVEGGQVELSAQNGRLHVVSSDVEVQDRVVVENEAYRLETERLTYDHGRRQIRIPTAVVIRSQGDRLSAAAMTIFIDDHRAELDGAVEGVFSGSILP